MHIFYLSVKCLSILSETFDKDYIIYVSLIPSGRLPWSPLRHSLNTFFFGGGGGWPSDLR